MRFSFTWNSSTLNRHVPSAASGDSSPTNFDLAYAFSDPTYGAASASDFAPDPLVAASAPALAAQASSAALVTGSVSVGSEVVAGSLSLDASLIGAGGESLASVGTGGSTALLATQLRSTFGIDGTGIKIGVLSDSFNDLGGAATDEADGALPSSVTVLQDGTSGTDEGRAMLQLVHQIAPGAQLYFATADGGDLNFANNIRALCNAGCNIIVDDAGYFDEPMFQDGTISQAIDSVVGRGAMYFTSAGNNASNAYQASWSALVPQTVTIGAGADILFELQWSDPLYGYATSLGMTFTDGFGDRVTSSQEGGVDYGNQPITLLELDNVSGGAITGTITIGNLSGPNPGLIKLVANGDGAPVSIADANTGTVVGHAEDPNAITVAAANSANDGLEFFSSSGAGAQWLFDASGNPISEPLSKVDLTGVDGIATTLPNGLSSFFGTSAAAPTAAAVAALLEQAAPGDSNTTIKSALESTATNLGDPAVLQGHGLVNALAAGDSIATPHVYVGGIGSKIYPGTGNNTVDGAPNDTISITQNSSNTINGSGDGTDTLDYSQAPGAITEFLGSNTVSHSFGGTDTFSNINSVVGTPFNDTFIGAGGNHTLDGGGGANTLDYSAATGPVSVAVYTAFDPSRGAFIEQGTATNGFGGTDTFKLVEGFKGGTGSNTFTIDGLAAGLFTFFGQGSSNTLNWSPLNSSQFTINLSSGTLVYSGSTVAQFSDIQFFKGFGLDTFVSGPGNHSISVIGGAGDTLDYSLATSPVTVNTATGVASNGFGGTDTFTASAITKFIGGTGNDTFIAGPGSHTFDGGGGINTVDYSSAPGPINFNFNGTFGGPASNGFGGFDTLTRIQVIIGSTHGSTLTVGPTGVSVTLVVEGGNDTVSGASGDTLTVDYSNAPGAITVNLATGTASNGFGGTDTLSNVQGIKGSTHGSTLIGASNDTFVITGGNNSITGGGGTNTVNYSSALGAVTVNLATGTAANGFGGTDTLANIETVIGSSSASDTFTAGTGGGETFTGGSGHNTYNFTSGDGHDVVTDFKAGVGGDQINLTDTNGAAVTITGTPGAGYTASDFGGGTFVATTGDASSMLFGSGDFLGNGERDFVLRSASGDTQNYVWNGSGYTVTDFGSTAGWSAIATGDFNGDGKTDILIRLADGTTASWLANGSGGFRGVLAGNSSGMSIAETGDFLGNGQTDLLWSDASSNISVWLANGDGTFRTETMGATTGWSFIGSGDFNGDGKTDILMRLADGTTASWLANGAGGFRGVIAGNSAGMSVAETGDFVGNGRTDILWRDASNNTTVWLANGDGTFTSVSLGMTTGWSFIGAGDFNGDGKTDILMRYADGTVADWLSRGDGFFTGAILGKAGPNWSVVTIGDLNGDGKADVVWRNNTDGRTVVWELSGGTIINSSGGTATITYGSGDSIDLLGIGPSSVAASQLVVTTPPIVGGPGDDTFVATPGSHSYDGGGGFNTLDYSAAPAPITVNLATGKVSPNGFGGTDNFVRIQAFKGSAGNDTFIGGAGNWTLNGGGGVNTLDYSAAPGAVTVNLATGTASNGFGGTDTLANIETVIGSSSASDSFTAGMGGGETFTGGSASNTYNFASGDGHDVVTDFKAGAGGDQINLADTSGAPVTITSSGGGYSASDFSGGALVGTTGSASSMVVASGDFTGSGKTDFILETPSTGAVQDELWNGSGYTTLNLSSVGMGATLLGAGNFQGNGKTSLLWRAADGTTAFWGANSDGTFTVSTIGQTGGWNFIASGDFNGDGKTDELLRSVDGSTTADWLSNGAGMFTGKLVASTAGMSVVATGEFAGTGRTDILWRAAGGTTTEWTANSDGSFNVTNLGDTSAWSFIASGDFLGNGKTDELLRNVDGTTTADWMSNGVGSFTGKLVQSTAGMSVIGTGDFNGDGRTDILWRATDGTVTTWLANGDGSFTSVMTGQAGMNWNVASIGNLDGDGNADVVWRDSADGRTVVWDMNGGAVTNGGTATISYGGSDSITLTGVSPSSLVSSQIAATIQGTAGNDTFVGSAANETFVGNGGSDTYQIARGGGQDRIVNGLSTNAGPTGQLDFGAGIATNQLWLQQSGSDLQIDVMGTTDHTTVANWYGSATAQLQEIKTADGSMLDAQLNNLVSAMATYSSAHPGFDPTAPVNASAPNDPTLQLAIATDWHH